MQHGFEHLGGHVGLQDGWQMVETARSSLQSGLSLLAEGVDGMANGLLVARERLGDAGDGFPTRGGRQDLAATEHKGIRRTQPGSERLVFLFGKVADKKAWFHGPEYTTFRLTFLENALGPRED